MDINYGEIARAFALGMGLGAFYFLGLWVTVSRLPSVPRPVLFVAVSFLVRLSVAGGGFLLIMDGRLDRLFAALLGFLVVRFVSVRLVRPAPEPAPSMEA